MTAPARPRTKAAKKRVTPKRKSPPLVRIDIGLRDVVMITLGLLTAWGFGLIPAAAQHALWAVLLSGAVLLWVAARCTPPTAPEPVRRKPRPATTPQEDPA